MENHIKLSLNEINALYEFAQEEGNHIFEIIQNCSSGISCDTMVINVDNNHETEITDYDVW